MASSLSPRMSPSPISAPAWYRQQSPSTAQIVDAAFADQAPRSALLASWPRRINAGIVPPRRLSGIIADDGAPVATPAAGGDAAATIS